MSSWYFNTHPKVSSTESIDNLVVDNISTARAQFRVSATPGALCNGSCRKRLEQGELIRIWHRRRTMRERRTVILWDTSRSMESITPMLFNFLHNLVKQRQVKVLSFSTQLTVVTPQLLNSSPEYALNALYEAAQDIHGGTRLQNAVDIAVRKYSRWLGQRTDVILLTDGFESGDIKTLSASIKALRRRCKRVVWWNPWASRPGYSYDTHSGQVIKQQLFGPLFAAYCPISS